MTRYIIRKYLSGNRRDGRNRAGILLGAAGIFFDLLLFAVKEIAGILSGSVAVTADAFNNLADAGAHIMALLAFPLGSRRPSKRFPFGYGRVEYLSGLVIAAAILFVGGKMIVSSVTKILHPAMVETSPVVYIILLFSIAVKGYMFRYNRIIGDRIDSAGLRSVALDSICDCFATGAIILSMIIQKTTGWNIDGWTGLMVAICILYAGLISAKDSVTPLLGAAVDDETLDKLYCIMGRCPDLVKIDAVAVHDYGPDRKLLTAQIQVKRSDVNIAALKQMILKELRMECVIETKIIDQASYNRLQNRQE